jgi:protein ImuB
MFVHDFAAEALMRAEPDLRDAALAVVEGKPPLLTVVAANERARLAGVECGMTNVQAAARLNRAATTMNPGVIRRRSPSQEAAAHAALADCARGFSPRVEECAGAPEAVLLDLNGLERLFGTPQKIARKLSRRASDLGLEINVAVSANLDTSICAARGFGGNTIIPKGKEADRLAPLPVEVLLQVAVVQGTARVMRKSLPKNNAPDKLTAERAAEILETLDRWGVRTFRALAALPEIAVAERLGPEGVYLQKLCRGEGTRTLVPTNTPLYFEEAMELGHPVDDLEPLAFVLSRLLEQLCARLAARALSTNELHLRMELDECRDYDIAEPRSEQRAETQSAICNPQSAIYEHTLRLPVPMLDAKVFLRLWQLEWRAKPPMAPITRVWLRAEPVQPRNTQAGLFLPATPEPERLELTLARIGNVVDEKSRYALHSDTSQVRVGSPEVLDTHRSDAFRMRRFSPSIASAESRGGRNADSQDKIGQTNHASAAQLPNGLTPLRLFRPPLGARVDVLDGRPNRVNAIGGGNSISGAISWCAGPWRTSGEWWNESWSREEWDVAVEIDGGRVVCRVYRDEKCGAWFVEGVYD